MKNDYVFFRTYFHCGTFTQARLVPIEREGSEEIFCYRRKAITFKMYRLNTPLNQALLHIFKPYIQNRVFYLN